MKEIGYIDINLLHENTEYKNFFTPLTGSEYNDLKESIAEAGILNNIIVEENGNGYVILSGHHRKAIARELGINSILCSLAETPEEKTSALLDNASRRQLTETQRKEYLRNKSTLINSFYQKGLIPEIYDLFTGNKLDKNALRILYNKKPNAQKDLLATLSATIKVPPAVVEKHKEEIKKVEQKYDELLSTEREKLQNTKDAMEKAKHDLVTGKEEMKELREKITDLVDQLEDKKGKLSKTIEDKYKKEIKELQDERITREHARKEKEDEIEQLKEQIKSLNNNITGLKTQASFWQHEISRIEEAYNNFLSEYANPGLIEVQLTVVEAYVQTLTKYVTSNKWDSRTIKIAEQFRTKIIGQLDRLVTAIGLNQKDTTISLESADLAVQKAISEKQHTLKAVRGRR